MKLVKSFIFLICIIFHHQLIAQESFILTSSEADCENAIDISGLEVVRSTAPIGSGKYMEVQSKTKSLYSFKKEHNTVWYRFTVTNDCELSFDIIPNNPKDDYDFLLYRSIGNPVCSSIRKGELKPIRSNISRPSTSLLGKTGLNSKAETPYVHEGAGNSWSLPLSVKKGEEYYLVLDNVYDHGAGHEIKIYFTNDSGPTEIVNKPLSVNINVVDKESKKLISASILLIDQSMGYREYDTLYNKASSSLFFPIESDKYYQYEVWSDGYLKEKDSFRLDSNDKSLMLRVELQPISVGKTFEIGDLYFVGGTDDIIRKSYPALRDLLSIMKNNPGLSIEIQGHVNYSSSSKEKKTEEYYNQLSVDRAKAVSNYLEKRGVDTSRLVCKGFGYTNMLFPNATTPQEMQRNRRVVIMITNF